jgi:predicted CXXCH cytochrome family protein
MNRIFVASLALLAFVAVARAQAADVAGTDRIKDTAHNFTSAGWSGGEICKPCHTPHNAIAQDVSTRLWNHAVTTATYTIGTDSSGVAETKSAVTDLDRVSRLCMSCHDGTVALDSFGGAASGTLNGHTGVGTNFLSGSRLLGTDLSNDHPVGNWAILDPLASRNGVLSWKPVSSSGRVNVGSTGLTLSLQKMANQTWTRTSNGVTSTVTGDAWVVGCTTCHTPHGAGYSSLLRAPNTGSQVCLSCHYK